MTRQEANKQLLAILTKLVEEQPDTRFSQLLVNYGVLKLHPGYNGVCFNEFYKESEELLERVKASVANINRT